MKNKLIIFLSVLVLSVSVFSVTAFAAVDETYSGYYTFVDELDFANGYFFDDIFFTVSGSPSGYSEFYAMEAYLEPGTAGLGWELRYYWGNMYPDEYLVVYTSDQGWLHPSYQSIYIIQIPYTFGQNILLTEFLSHHELVYDDISWYHTIYDLLKDSMFSEIDPPSEAVLALSLVSIILTFGAVLLPVLVSVFVIVWVFKRL